MAKKKKVIKNICAAALKKIKIYTQKINNAFLFQKNHLKSNLSFCQKPNTQKL